VQGFFAALIGTVEIEAFEPRSFFPSGDTVLVLGHTRARHREAGRGVFASDWAHVFTVRDGRQAGFQEFYDTAAIERALAA
jgi:ketosteroid isomerase-like protein